MDNELTLSKLSQMSLDEVKQTVCSLAVFWILLDRFDWFYSYSDDGSVWRHGDMLNDRLIMLAAANGDEYVQMYSSFGKHHFSGEPWKTPKAPKPPKPEA